MPNTTTVKKHNLMQVC